MSALRSTIDSHGFATWLVVTLLGLALSVALFFLSLQRPGAALSAGTDTEYTEIPVVVNLLQNSGVAEGDATQAIAKANEFLKQLNSKLVVVKINKDTTAGDDGSGGGTAGDGALNDPEGWKVLEAGGKEIDGLPDKKGMKITFALVPDTSSTTPGWSVHRNPTIVVKKRAGTDQTAETIFHELLHVFTLAETHTIDASTTSDGHGHAPNQPGGSGAGNGMAPSDYRDGTNVTTDQIEKIKKDGELDKRGRKVNKPDSATPGAKVEQQNGNKTDNRDDQLPAPPFFDVFQANLFSATDDTTLHGRLTLGGNFRGPVFGYFGFLFDTDNNVGTGANVNGFDGIDRVVKAFVQGDRDAGGLLTQGFVIDYADGTRTAVNPLNDVALVPANKVFDLDATSTASEDGFNFDIPKAALGITANEAPVVASAWDDTNVYDTATMTLDMNWWQRQPSLTAPASAQLGDTITVSGGGFAPGELVSLYFGETLAATGTADPGGTFTSQFPVQPQLTFSRTEFVTAVGDSGDFGFNVIDVVRPPGPDPYFTRPIPSDFFEPGSAPFQAPIELGGPPAGTDTVVMRRTVLVQPQPAGPGSETVPIELVALNLVSVEPITVRVDYSTDTVNWVPVGTDTSPTPQAGDGLRWFSGFGDTDTVIMRNGTGGYGFNMSWETTGLPDGPYILRASMTDGVGTTDTTDLPVFIDRTPPVPEFLDPAFEQVIGGLHTIEVTSTDENIASLEVALQDKGRVPNIIYGDTTVTQTGLGHRDQNGLNGAGTGGMHCGPTAAKNALERLIPTKDETENLERARTLAHKMDTDDTNGTASDNFEKGLQDYLKEIGKDTSLTVTHHGTEVDDSDTITDRPHWDDFETALRSGESVVALIARYLGPGPDGLKGTADDQHDVGHYITMEDKDSKALAANTYKISYVDPWGGVSKNSTWTASGNATEADTFEYDPPWTAAADSSGWHVLDIWEISPAANSPPPGYSMIGTDTDGSDGWSVPWDAGNVPDGYYVLWTQFTDSDGNKGAAKQVVRVDNPPTTTLSTNPAQPNGSNGWFKTLPSITLHRNQPGVTSYQWDSTSPAGWTEATGTPTVDSFFDVFVELAPNPEGQHTLYYYSADSDGNTETVRSRVFKIDTRRPNRPGLSTPVYSTNQSKTTKFRPSWSATDPSPGSGIHHYQVQYIDKPSNITGWRNWLTATAARSADFPGAQGHTYLLRARAIDGAGNASDWSVVGRTTVPIDNTASLLGYSTGWTSFSNISSLFYLGTVKHSGAAGARVSYGFNAKQIALISTKGSNRGKAAVFIDNVFKGIIDTYAASAQFRRPVFVWPPTPRATAERHTLRLEVLHQKRAASTGYRFDVDGFAIVK